MSNINLKRKASEDYEEPIKRVASSSGQNGSDGEDSDDGLQVSFRIKGMYVCFHVAQQPV